MSDSGRDSIRSNALGLAVASDPAEQSGDISAPSEIFDLSEDIDSILEEGSEVMFECLTQSSGVVKEIIPSQGCTETDIRFCILLGQKLPRNYKGLSFQANFANIATVPLKRDGPALTGNIISSLAGKVKVTLEYKGSNGKSIGFTYFEFTKNSERVILEEISKVRMSQDAMYKTVNSLAVSRSSGVQQETPRGARGTGVGMYYCKVSCTT
ncbi:uncharacterized protein LOC111338552 [Stylophora pistillata]|uniref:uncharacterized protein LOC111338552 n=1 Tax=Stylophora pistillata TaxID=50429 RepID=UPI000C0403D0|nr:uncharacterized protein LOC111338552 [Stylophora pistillata]